MPDDIAQQQALLTRHRQTLAHLLQQAAAHGGEVFAPPPTANGIAEARTNIRHIKAHLRVHGVVVEDAPHDDQPPYVESVPRQSAGGDVVRGDKVAGDKVLGDKRTVDTGGGDYAEGNIDKRSGIFYAAEQAYDVRGLSNPYLGLRSFTYAEHARYAGRKQQIAEAVKKLTLPGNQCALLFVTGASGSGKSSFAQAGIVPALEQHYAPGITVRIIEGVRPSQRPVENLLDALQRRVRLPSYEVDTDALPDSFYTFLANNTDPEHVNIIVLDQFEELFASDIDHAQRDVFFAILTNLPPFMSLRTHLIVTMRADYLPELFAHDVLYDEAKRGIDLRAMTVNELKDAIQRPLQQHPDARDKRFEPALLDRLAADAAADAAYLPLLQVTLEKIWDDGALKLSAYHGLTDAIKERRAGLHHNARRHTAHVRCTAHAPGIVPRSG